MRQVVDQDLLRPYVRGADSRNDHVAHMLGTNGRGISLCM